MGARGAGSTVERTWSTAELPEPDQFAFWQAAASEAFCPVTVRRRDDGPFFSQVTVRRVGAIDVSRIRSGGQVVRRVPGPGEIRSGDQFFLNLPLTGSASAEQDGRVVRLQAGDFAIVDSTRPFELSFDGAFEQISLSMPHELVARRCPDPAQITAMRVPGRQGIGAFASTMLQRLVTDGSPLDREGARGVNDRVVDLVALALSGVGAGVATRSNTRRFVLQAALDEIERSLGDPGLAPDDVAIRVHISTRYLHQLFGQLGVSFGRWVAQRRLARCHELLCDPERAGCEIGEIAFAHGFRDASYFARAFKARYGVTPGELRRDARSRDLSAGVTRA